jgi:hypothetical protein
MRNLLPCFASCFLVLAACGTDGPVAAEDEAETEADPDLALGGAGAVNVTTPFPIDGGDLPGAPDRYKGLPLQLADNGAPAVTAVRGVIGVVCIGMSNSNQECGDYIQKLGTTFAGQVNAKVRVVNCAVGGHAIEKWNDPAYDATLWDACLNQRIGQRGVAADQIRVIYHKAANQFTTGSGGQVKPAYPDPGSDYFAFRANLTTFAGRLAQKMPAVQAVYTTSRSYGGFAEQASRGEPLSYEEGHALNTWLAAHPTIGGVWYGWGPYVWAPDCADGTNGSGTCYVRSDYVADGVHPAQGARDKISQLIHARFSRDAWYRP